MKLAPEYVLAAAGDHNAQSDMAHMCAQLGFDGQIPIPDALSFAELWARMAATSGETDHRLDLVTLLLWRASLAKSPQDDEARDTMNAESLMILGQAADEGSEQAGAVLVALADIVAPKIILRAIEMSANEEEVKHG